MADDYFNLNNWHNLPYLKHIEMMKLTPRHFGLESWTRLFVIPDHIMRKIYRQDAWMDMDAPFVVHSEQTTKEQRLLLARWLNSESPFRRDSVDVERQTRRSSYDDDDLRELLDSPSNWIRVDKKTCDTIATCAGHAMQPESAIVERAIANMNHLSNAEEQTFQSLLRDKEYMTLLDQKIKAYLDSCARLGDASVS